MVIGEVGIDRHADQAALPVIVHFQGQRGLLEEFSLPDDTQRPRLLADQHAIVRSGLERRAAGQTRRDDLQLETLRQRDPAGDTRAGSALAPRSPRFQECDQVGELLGGKCSLQAGGHQRDGTFPPLRALGDGDDVPLAVLVHERDIPFCLLLDDPVEQPAGSERNHAAPIAFDDLERRFQQRLDQMGTAELAADGRQVRPGVAPPGVDLVARHASRPRLVEEQFPTTGHVAGMGQRILLVPSLVGRERVVCRKWTGGQADEQAEQGRGDSIASGRHGGTRVVCGD